MKRCPFLRILSWLIAPPLDDQVEKNIENQIMHRDSDISRSGSLRDGPENLRKKFFRSNDDIDPDSA